MVYKYTSQSRPPELAVTGYEATAHHNNPIYEHAALIIPLLLIPY